MPSHRALLLLLLPLASAKVLDFETLGAIPNSGTHAHVLANGALLNATLAQLQPGDTLLVPNKTFSLMGGIIASGVRHATIRLEGTLRYAFGDGSGSIADAEAYLRQWPRSTAESAPGKVRPMLLLALALVLC